jgi:hypothetical protein
MLPCDCYLEKKPGESESRHVALGSKPADRSGTLPLLNAQKQVVIVRIQFFDLVRCKYMMAKEMCLTAGTNQRGFAGLLLGTVMVCASAYSRDEAQIFGCRSI